MTGGTKRKDERRTQAGNWTNGERRGKYMPVKIDASAAMSLSPGQIRFEIKLRRTVERADDEDDQEQSLRIELSLEHARHLHEALSHAFLDLVQCEKKRDEHHDCGGWDVRGGRSLDCEACEERKAERAALWECVKKWDAGQKVDALEPGCSCLVAMHPRPGQRHDEDCAGYPKQFFKARDTIAVVGKKT